MTGEDVIERFTGFVTAHNRLVILLVLVLTVGVVAGVGQDSGEASMGVDDDALGDTEVYQAAEYIEERYGGGDEDEGGEDEGDEETIQSVDVYVMDEEGSVLDRAALLSVLEYQLEVTEAEPVADALAEDGVTGPPNVVATQLADEPDADLETQRDAVADASDEAVADVVASTFTGGEDTRFYLPSTYETGSTDAEAYRMSFAFAETEQTAFGTSAPSDAQEVLYDTAGEYDDPDVFTIGPFASGELNQAFIADSMWLVLPPILLLLIVVLGFAYRDVTDVVIGFLGSIFALLWTVGLMGWMGILNQQTALIAPVLITALSIDFGFHVFMRYRERRGPEDGIRDTMRRSTAAVTVAFLLVTITAAIGFLANLTSPVSVVGELGVAITLGVISALFIFTTLVPALKVSADGLWERFGFDRHKTALGKGRHLSRVLGAGVTGARRYAVPVIVVALILGVVGGLAFAELDREPFQTTDFDEVAEWKTNLPGPMAFEAHESDVAQRFAYAQGNFQADQEGVADGGSGFTQLLVDGGDVATPEAMEAVAAGHEAAEEADENVVLRQGDSVHTVSVLSAMRELAASDEAFAASFDAADTDDDEVPEADLAPLFDEFYEATPEQASQVLEQTDDGAYASTIVMVPAQATFGTDRADAMQGIADEMEDASGLTVTAVGVATLNAAELAQITDGIVVTMGLALLGVLVLLAVVYRVARGSAVLGAVTVLPIALTLGLVFGGMHLLGQPLTMLTALLVSISIGLGIDYNIHVSDRFVQELERTGEPITALREAVTGTGGALLGSAITSGGAFALLTLVPEKQFTSFGLIVAMALVAAFLLSVFVLPSLLYLWSQYVWHGADRSVGSESGVTAE